jgi:hypothetical protein
MSISSTRIRSDVVMMPATTPFSVTGRQPVVARIMSDAARRSVAPASTAVTSCFMIERTGVSSGFPARSRIESTPTTLAPSITRR